MWEVLKNGNLHMGRSFKFQIWNCQIVSKKMLLTRQDSLGKCLADLNLLTNFRSVQGSSLECTCLLHFFAPYFSFSCMFNSGEKTNLRKHIKQTSHTFMLIFKKLYRDDEIWINEIYLTKSTSRLQWVTSLYYFWCFIVTLDAMHDGSS